MLNKKLALLIANTMKSLNLDKVDTDSFEFRFVVQKVSYVLQKVGCDLGLKFGWYSLGPYAKILQNYYNMVASVLNVEMYGGSGIEEELEGDLKICVEKAVTFLNDYKKYVGEINVESLEILASLMMLCTEIYPKPSSPVDELLKRKKNISQDLAVKTWKFLVDKNICTL